MIRQRRIFLVELTSGRSGIRRKTDKRRPDTEGDVLKKKLIKIIGIIAMAMILAGTTLFMSVSLSLPDISGYTYSPKLKTQIRTQDGKLIGEVYDENRTLVKIDKMPENLKNAVVATEDRRFYKHNGFDIRGILRAIVVNTVTGGKAEGASTITQQVARRLFLSDERTYTRKIKEILLAVKLEQEMSKEEILEIYLNDVFMGQGTYGVEEASKRFFDKHVKDITLEESALLAGIPQAPTLYNPTTKSGYKESKARKEWVLDKMVDCKYITQDECDKAKKVKIAIRKRESRKNFNGRHRKGCGAYNQQVLREVKRELIKNFTKRNQMSKKAAQNKVEQMIEQDGLQITCSMNIYLQTGGVKAVKSFMSAYGLTKRADMAFVTVDGASGAVVAYYGGKSSIDMANTPRQPGSTVKPLYVSKYLEREDKTIYSTVQDGKINLYGYAPKNFGDHYMGTVTIKQAITNSLNTACLRIYDELGVNSNGDYAGFDAIKEFGFSTLVDVKDNPVYNDNNYAIALGGFTYGFKPLELASAYSTFANDGKKYDYWFVEKVTTNSGKVLYKRKTQKAKRIRSRRATKAIIECMKGVVSGGTGTNARTKYTTFGKTGTTHDNKDFWFSGVTGDLATSIWVGTPSNKVLYGISSSGVASFYRRYVNNVDDIANFGKISRVNAKKDSSDDKIKYINVLVVPDYLDIEGREYFTRLEVESVSIPEEDKDLYEDRIVEKVIVDAKTGDLFNDEKCDIEDKEIRYYLTKSVPKDKCNSLHIF